MFITRLIVASAVCFCGALFVCFFLCKEVYREKIKYFHLAIISVIAVIIAVFNPLRLDFNQNILFSAMIFTVALWATSAVHKSIALYIFIDYSLFSEKQSCECDKFCMVRYKFVNCNNNTFIGWNYENGLIHKYVEKLLKSSSSSIFKLLCYRIFLVFC